MAKSSFVISANPILVGKTMAIVMRSKLGIGHLARLSPNWLRSQPEWRSIVIKFYNTLIDIMPFDSDVVYAFATYGSLTKNNQHRFDAVFEKLYGANDELLVEFLARSQRIVFALLYELLKNKRNVESFMLLLSGNRTVVYDINRLKGILRWWWLKRLADADPKTVYENFTRQSCRVNVEPAQWMLEEYKQVGWQMTQNNLTYLSKWWNQKTWRAAACILINPYRIHSTQIVTFITYFEEMVAATQRDAGLMAEFTRIIKNWPFLLDKHLQMFKRRIPYLGRRRSIKQADVKLRFNEARSAYLSLIRKI